MAPYVLRRLAGTVVLLAAVVILTFLLISLVPGDTALTLAGSGEATLHIWRCCANASASTARCTNR